MEDSFFGFDTSVPLYDDGGGGRLEEPSEEEYDALNDETFGSATNGDWESAHESLVRLKRDSDVPNNVFGYSEKNSNQVGQQQFSLKKQGIDHLSDSDLELNLSDMKLDDMKVDDSNNLFNNEDILLDPSVWSPSPVKQTSANEGKALAYLQQYQHLYPYSQLNRNAVLESNKNNMPQKLPSRSPLASPNPRICTLQDIEKRLINQQNNHQKANTSIDHRSSRSGSPSQLQNVPFEVKQQIYAQNNFTSFNQHHPIQGPPGFIHNQHKTIDPTQHNNGFNKHVPYMNLPPNFVRNENQNNSNQFQMNDCGNPMPHLNQQVNMAQARNLAGGPLPLIPPNLQHGLIAQIPPHPLLNHGYNKNFGFQHSQTPMPSSQLPIALNNFAMHPNFAVMRAAAVANGVHQASFLAQHQASARLPPQPNPQLIANQQNSNFNMFNTRLLQEIQQNHPLLQASVRQLQQNVAAMQNNQQRQGFNKGNATRRDAVNGNGNLPSEEFDEYANLMSTRDKHWLIGIQLSQLSSDTPYIDDYYYTVYRERKAVQNGSFANSRAHKDNQLNHPLTQPKGHAQLVMVQLGNKNGTRNGNQRERRSSENNEQRTNYGFVNYKFENSLGKLQFGSVNAPRKLIDAEVMNSESASQNSGSTSNSKIGSDPLGSLLNINKIAISTQRKTRDTLLHIETLFRIVLKLEDLDNPTIMATILTKKKKESERLAVLEQIENANKGDENIVDNSGSQALNPALRNRFNYEIESKESLLEKLFAGLTQDKIISMMHVRKGKVLLSRILPHISNGAAYWAIWIAIFSAIPNVLKKDPEDPDGLLYALYPEFKKQIKTANFDTIVKLVTTISFEEKKSSIIICNKFVMSAFVALILRVEKIYVDQNDKLTENGNEEIWKEFLKWAANSLEKTIQNQTISAAIESEAIQPMINHFTRYKNLNLNALSNLIKEAKEQIK